MNMKQISLLVAAEGEREWQLYREEGKKKQEKGEEKVKNKIK